MEKIALKIRHYNEKESFFDQVKKKLWILYHEIIRDDVAIRAESLSYFTLFSIMPIVAGLFLLLSAFSQWAPVQNDFQELIQKFLQPIPDEHRKNLLAFIFEFKDVYLQKITKSGSSLGFFALIVLVVIAGKVFINLEDLMNRIWSTKENRPWGDRIRNLILAMVILPASIFFALSLPGLVEKFAGLNLGIFVEKGLPAILLISTLFFLFKYFPNVAVKPKNAFLGAVLSGFLFAVSNSFLSVYFKFGTQSAYGKAAVIPLVAFFIYVSWFIVMIGAEWSFILQNEKSFTDEDYHSPNLQKAAVLLEIIKVCKQKHLEGKPPLSENELNQLIEVSHRVLSMILDFLNHQGVLVKSIQQNEDKEREVYAFAYDPERIDLIEIVKEFLNIDRLNQKIDVNEVLTLISKK